MNIEFTELEEKKWLKFQKKHQKCNKNSGAIGGIFKIIVTPTSIGDFIEVECTVCGKTKDITDKDKL